MLVSVVIPTHNRSKLVLRAVKSVLDQSYENIEVIIVDDGSTDDTFNIIDDFNDSRIQYVKNEVPKGSNYSRNRGINMAKGEYIAFLDDDDVWLQTKLEKQVNKILNNKNIGLVYTGTKIIYVDEKINYYNIPRHSGDLSTNILFKNIIGTTSTVIIKKKIFEDIGLFDEKLSALQDYDLWIRACQNNIIGFVDEPLVEYYNYRATKQISSNTDKYVQAQTIIEAKYADLFAHLNSDQISIREQEKLLLLYNKELRNNNRRSARQISSQLIKIKPSIKYIVYYVFSFIKYRHILLLKRMKGA